MGVVNGWERVDCMKPSPEFREEHGYRFTAVDEMVGAEVGEVAGGVGLTDLSGFNRQMLTGRDARSFLDRMVCGAPPRKPGRVGLCYLLNRHGRVKAEATVAALPASNRGPAGSFTASRRRRRRMIWTG